MEHLTNRHGDPLFPQDTKERVYEQCRTARNILLKVYNNVNILRKQRYKIAIWEYENFLNARLSFDSALDARSSNGICYIKGKLASSSPDEKKRIVGTGKLS